MTLYILDTVTVEFTGGSKSRGRKSIILSLSPHSGGLGVNQRLDHSTK